jgi:hypothetical protein
VVIGAEAGFTDDTSNERGAPDVWLNSTPDVKTATAANRFRIAF